MTVRGLRSLRWAVVLLLGVGFVDEFASGLPYTLAYAVQESFETRVTTLNLALFVGPQAFALLVEPLLLLRAERWPQAGVLAGSIGTMALALALAAVASNTIVFGVAVALYFPSSGLACGTAQVRLMQTAGRRERKMTDWALAGALGDFATPLLLWAVAAAGLGWRWTFALCAGLLGAFAWCWLTPCTHAWMCSSRGPSDSDAPAVQAQQPPEELTLRGSLDVLVGNRQALLWLSAGALCGLLDELFASFVGLRIHAEASTTAVAQQLLACSLGGGAGLVVLRAALPKARSERLLVRSCVGCTLCYVVWLLLDHGLLSLMAIFVMSAFSAAHYPLTQARAYAAFPTRANLIAAASQLFSGVELLYPLAMGVLADEWGIGLALLFPVLQPVGILVLARAAASTRSSPLLGKNID